MEKLFESLGAGSAAKEIKAQLYKFAVKKFKGDLYKAAGWLGVSQVTLRNCGFGVSREDIGRLKKNATMDGAE